jgi:hypothetical protein
MRWKSRVILAASKRFSVWQKNRKKLGGGKFEIVSTSSQ